MSILSQQSIKSRIESWDIIYDPIERLDKLISKQSIDCTLYPTYFIKINLWFLKHDMTEIQIFNHWDFVLCIIDEWVGTKAWSGLCMEFKLKSTSARLGINHPIAWFCENWYFSRLCIELSFSRTVYLQAWMSIWQFIFHTIEWDTIDYVEWGSYQNHSTLEEVKANWKPEDILPKSLVRKI